MAIEEHSPHSCLRPASKLHSARSHRAFCTQTCHKRCKMVQVSHHCKSPTVQVLCQKLCEKDIPTQEHVVGRKIILNKPGAYRGRASKIIQERCICSYLDASPAQMLLSSILGNLLLRFGVENILHLLNIATATIPRNRSEICSRPWVSKVLVCSRQVLSVETICAQAN